MRPGGLLLPLGLWFALAGAGCGGSAAAVRPQGVTVAVDSDTAFALRRRVDGFYLRLANRRFNTLETYADRIMREHFRTPNLFLDYYADLAQDLADAHFERRRPLEIEVLDLAFEDPRSARVEVRFVGQDDRPLRPNEVAMIRVDRWVFDDESWWVEPGKI